MPQKITEVFNDHETGMAAIAALKQHGFEDSQISSVSSDVTASAAEAGETQDDLARSLSTHGVAGAQAADYAAGIRRGAFMVTVEPYFGQAKRAIQILQEFGPVDPQHMPEPAPAVTEDDAAPMSSALGLRLLWDNPAPLSALLNLPVLAKDKSPSVQLWSNRPAPLSDALGLPTLTKSSR